MPHKYLYFRFCLLLHILSYNRKSIPHPTTAHPTRGTPETRRKWSTSTLPSDSLSPAWGKLCPLFPSTPGRHWWQLPWSHPGLLQMLKSLASRWEPSSPGKEGKCVYYLQFFPAYCPAKCQTVILLVLSAGCKLWQHESWNCRLLFWGLQRYSWLDQSGCQRWPRSEN